MNAKATAHCANQKQVALVGPSRALLCNTLPGNEQTRTVLGILREVRGGLF